MSSYISPFIYFIYSFTHFPFTSLFSHTCPSPNHLNPSFSSSKHAMVLCYPEVLLPCTPWFVPYSRNPSVQKVLHCWPIVMGVTLGHRGWGYPKKTLGGAWTGCPFLWVLNLDVPPNLRWAWEQLSRAMFGVPFLPLPFCAPLWVCRRAFLT